MNLHAPGFGWIESDDPAIILVHGSRFSALLLGQDALPLTGPDLLDARPIRLDKETRVRWADETRLPPVQSWARLPPSLPDSSVVRAGRICVRLAYRDYQVDLPAALRAKTISYQAGYVLGVLAAEAKGNG